MSHTPGPWTFRQENESGHSVLIRSIVAEGRDVALMCDTAFYPWCPDDDDDWKLIAAAPDLLATLKSVEEYLSSSPYATDSDFELQRVRVAIAAAEPGWKAEG